MDLLTIDEVAKILKRSKKAVYGLLYRQVLKPVRVGRRLYVRLTDLQDAIKS